MKILDIIMATVAVASITATSVVAAPLALDFDFDNLNQNRSTGLGIGRDLPDNVGDLVGACPDLKVSATQQANPDGTIEVHIDVTNISAADYVSKPDQQMLVINGTNGGESGILRFARLDSGESVQWSDTFEPFEFAATYRARVSFDPDIRIDGNPRNDDCRAANDHAELTTAH